MHFAGPATADMTMSPCRFTSNIHNGVCKSAGVLAPEMLQALEEQMNG